MTQILEFTTNHPLLILAFLANVMMLIFIEYGRISALYKNISCQEAVILQNNESVIFLDVREDKEYKAGHLIDAIAIPLRNLSKELSQLKKYTDKNIVVYCASGNRSMHASKILTKNEFTKVFNLTGGISAWQKANLPTTVK